MKFDKFIALTPLSSLFFTVSTAYAILAHQLFDIRVIIRRTVVYSGLLLFVLGFYFMIVFIATAILGSGNLSTFQARNLIPNIIAAIFIALGFDPIRRKLILLTENYLFKSEYDAQTVLRELTGKLNDVVALDEALEVMMQSMVKVLHLRHAATFVLQMGDNNQVAVKRIKQIGYSSTAKLVLDDRDLSLVYFSNHPQVLEIERFKEEVASEQFSLETGHNRRNHKFSEAASAFIREHAIKQSVLKKLIELDVTIVIPLHLNKQPIGLIILSDKLSGDPFFPEDLELLDTIGSQAISSIQKANLYEGDQMKTEFVSIASHELLTPISAIEGYLSMILDENIGKIDKQAREYLTKVYTSTKRLSTLIKDLLSVSRIESGKLKIEPQSLDLEKLIRDAIDQLKFIAKEKNLELKYNPPAKKISPVWADPDRTTQVITNLLGNGIKYTQRGSVSVTPTQKGQMVYVAVEDTGIGMSAKAQTHLFEKFYRVDNSETTGVTGTGLGLYISKSIVEKMGGTIDLKSAEGKGTTFTFSLPIFKVEVSKNLDS